MRTVWRAKTMTKSNMRIYKGRGYSDHEINLYIAVDMEDVYFLHIKTLHEEITLPVHDILDAITDD